MYIVCVMRVCILMYMYVLSRSDANQNNLRTSAYEALIDLIKYSAKVSCTYIIIILLSISIQTDPFSTTVSLVPRPLRR